MTDLDAQISKAHGAAEATENEARQVEARICRIQGAARYLPHRRYGSPVSGDEIRKNLTLASLIARHDAPLAAFLGVASGEHRRRDEEQAARAMQAQALAMETERIRTINAASTRYREQQQLAGINPLTGRRWGQ